jgi:hypothetical protein
MKGRSYVTDKPTSTADRIADAGMEAMVRRAEEEGVELGDSLILVSLDGDVEDGINATTHPHITSHDGPYPTPTDVLAFTAAHVMSLARAAGIPLDMTIAGESLGTRRRKPAGRGRRGRVR